MNKMNMEDRIKRLEDIILGKLVVNKESPLEKILLSQGLSEEKILDMQKQMIDYMKNGWLLENAKPVESEPEKTFTEMVEGWMPDQECEEKSKLCKCEKENGHYGEGCNCYFGEDAIQCSDGNSGCGTWYDPKIINYFEKEHPDFDWENNLKNTGIRCPNCLGQGFWGCLECGAEMYPDVGFNCTKGNTELCTSCEEKSKLCKCGHSIDMHMEGMDAKYEWIGHDGNGTTDSSILKQLEGASDNDLLCIDCWCKNFENEKESK